MNSPKLSKKNIGGKLAKKNWGNLRNTVKATKTDKPFIRIIDPKLKWVEYWKPFIFLISLFLLLEGPFNAAFNIQSGFSHVLLMSFLWVDIFLSFHMGYVEHAETILTYSMIKKRYIKSYFYIDLIASLPFAFILRLPQFSLNQLFLIVKVYNYINKQEIDYRGNLIFWRTLKILLSLFFISHLLGCMWYSIALYEGFGSTPFVTVWTDLNN